MKLDPSPLIVEPDWTIMYLTALCISSPVKALLHELMGFADLRSVRWASRSQTEAVFLKNELKFAFGIL